MVGALWCVETVPRTPHVVNRKMRDRIFVLTCIVESVCDVAWLDFV